MNKIEFGDCRDTMRRWAAEGVKAQTCVTSPPYFGLRDYGHEGQIGLEQTPEEYIAAMVDVFRCVRDVLADDGTLWLNIGDSYASSTMTGGNNGINASGGIDGFKQKRQFQHKNETPGCKPKDLIGIPWMLAFALRADGWYLRQDIIWHKPNPMPESVRDRCTKAHEYIFLLSKSKRYFFDSEAMREQSVDPEGSAARYRLEFGGKKSEVLLASNQSAWPIGMRMREFDGKRNRRSVWTVATRPYKGAHFAAFPPALIEPCILAGTSEKGHCPQCGSRWIRKTERSKSPHVENSSLDRFGNGEAGVHRKIGQAYQNWLNENPVRTVGWEPACKCKCDAFSDIVLDPFMGSGTTAAVALQHGRQYLGCEINESYGKLQQERLNKFGGLFERF